MCSHFLQKVVQPQGDLLPSAIGEILQRSQNKTHVDTQLQIFKVVYGHWMHKSLPKCGLQGFHGTCASVCCVESQNHGIS